MLLTENINISEKPTETLYVSREEYVQVYEAGEPSVETWKNTFETFVKENQTKINGFYETAAILYGCTVPKAMRVTLVFNPNKGNIKGEPVDNLSRIDPSLEKQTDVMYWVPEPDEHMLSPTQVDKHIRGVLHEGEHRFFQGHNGNLHQEGFNTFLAEIDNDTEIIALREKLFGTNTGYLEPTNELITVYLESLYDLQTTPNSETLIDFVTGEEVSFKILLAAMHYQEQNYGTSLTTQGPYAKLRKGYREFSGRVLKKENISSINEEVDETTGGAAPGEIKVSPYNFRGKLPNGLLEEYVAANKTIDKDFIVRLYSMAIQEMGEK